MKKKTGPVINYSLKFATEILIAYQLTTLLKFRFLKLMLQLIILIYFDLFCLTETFLYFLDSLLRLDHPMNMKRGVVCIYYKEHLPVICKPNYYKEHLPVICKPNLTPLDECLVCELKVGNKICFTDPPSQSLEDVSKF